MSANRSVDRFAVAHEKDRFAVAHEKDRFVVAHEKNRFVVAHEKDRFVVAHEKNRFVVAHEKNRSSLCSFTFADGRRCRTPRCSAHPHLCFFHARKEAQTLAAQQMGRDIAADLSGSYLSACDLSSALARLFRAAALGHVKPKTASTLAHLGQTLLQSIHLAQDEYINAFGTDYWRRTIRSPFAQPSPATEPSPKPNLPLSATPRLK
jgi:hypothetical protein